MARNKDFFVNSTPKRDKSFFVKEDTKKVDKLWVEDKAPNVLEKKTQQSPNALTVNPNRKKETIQVAQKQTLGGEIGNFFKVTLPQAAEDLWDDIKEPFVGKSEKQLLTEAKLTPKMLVEDAKIQLAKEDPTREDYALVKQTQDVIKKYGTPESNIRAISEDTTQLQKDLERAEKTWQASPVDAAVANTGAAVTGIFGNLGSFANSLGADKVPLLKEVTNFAVDGARKAQENAQQYNKGNYGEALGTVTQGVVNLVPYFLIGTGTTAVKGATAVTKYGKYIEPVIKNPSFWYSLTSMWGQKYQEKLDEGYNRLQALGNAILYAFPASLIEVSGGIGAKGKETQSLLRTMGEEIAEEIAQDIMSGISDKATTNHDLPIFSMTEDAIINPKQLGKTALYTAPIVAIGGGANNVINKSINNRVENQKVQAQINQDLQNLRNQNPQNVNSTIQRKNVTGLPKLEAQNQAQTQNINQPNITLPNQAEMAQNANMNQIRDNTKLITQRDEQTLQSAKIAGMTDIDMNRVKELNNMLRSGTRLNFYDEKTIPQNVQADKAKIANGFYKDGALWINKNSKNKVEQILGHELTHHLETTDSYTDLSNTILDSEVFYDFIAEKGYANVAEYKNKLKEMGYEDTQLDNELVARFVEEKMFTDQKSIDRLARQNTKLVEKIKNWISDLVVSFRGTAQEKELRRIENMYRTALEQARGNEQIDTKVAGEGPAFSLSEKVAEQQWKLYSEKADNAYNVRDEYLEKRKEIENSDEYKEIWNKYKNKELTIEETNNEFERIGLNEAARKAKYYDERAKEYSQKSKEFAEILDEYDKKSDESISADDRRKLAVKEFGYTPYFYDAGYLLPDGKMLNFSGNKGQHSRTRGDDHRRIGVIYAGKEGAKAMTAFMNEGNVRIMYESPGIDISTKTPITSGQYSAIKNMVNECKERGYFSVDFSDENGKVVENLEYKGNFTAEQVVNDIKNYLTTGKVTRQSDIQRFRTQFSLPETDNQGRTLSKEQQEFFKDSKVRDENGKLLEVYHGTPSGGFTIFDVNKLSRDTKTSQYGKGFYFTDKQNLAKVYSEGEKSQLYSVYLDIKKPFTISWLYDESHNLDRDGLKNILLEGNNKEFYDKWIANSQSNIERLGNLSKDDISRMSKEEKVELFLKGEYDRFNDQHILKELVRAFNTNRELIDSMQRNLGYDGIIVEDKLRGNQYIAFNPNQIKAVDNTNPTENPDIRYSMNPVEVAKNPPNIETGLDQLKRTSRVKEGDTQSNFTRNIYNQSIFDDKFKDLALDDKNIKSYASISNKETLQEANDAINEQGQKWVDRFLDKPNGEMKATDIAGGFILMNRYQQAGDYESMIRVAEKLRKAGTQQGQTIQMFSVLGRMTPEGMTYYAQKELSKAYDEILKNKTQKWAHEHADEFKLNDKDIEYIQRRVNQAAKLPEGRDKYVLLGEIASRIQNKIPPQAGQGLKALARNSMLLNPKTMVRNVLGNVVIVPNHIVSDFVGAGIDKAISKKTGVRTTGGFDVKALQGAKKGIYESFDDFRRKISTREMGGDRFEIGQGKNFYENHTGRFGETRNKINKALNGLDRVTGFLLETGDRPFYETWFINSLNNQMKLNNVTEPTAEMIEIATDEALQRTWQDNNSYTRVVKSVRDGLNKLNVKGYGLGDMVMPFVKTPANLTKAVIDFSPLGAINAAVKTSQFNKDIGKGTATTKQQREVVKAWSQVITGTLGMAMLTALANAGVLTGGSDEDKDVRAFEQNILGIKPYSIKIGDKTYTYDWAQPLGTSAAMVADTVKSLKNAKDTEGKVAAILEGAQSGASVLLEQSFVSGIRNLFEEDNLINALIETGFNEASKFTPQFLSQLAQIQDDTARTSYVYNNIPQTALNKVKAKIPGLRQTLEPSVDVLGREVKTDNSIGNVMFNPANTAFARNTKGAEEMYRVYQATGDKSTIAQVAPYYFNVGSEKIVLTPKQRTQYQKTIGKIASDGVENLIDNKAYKNLADADKAEILKDLYSYGNAIAKEEASTSYLLPSEMQKIKDSGMKPEEYILLKYISNLGGTKKDDMYNSLISAGYSQKDTQDFLTYYKGYKFENTGKNTLPTLSQQRAKLPTLKK